MIEKIINFFRKIFGKEEPLRIEEPKKNIINQERLSAFQENLQNSANDRIRLLNIQEDIKSGKITEKDLESKDINLLKELYCEQIIELANSIDYYTKRIKA